MSATLPTHDREGRPGYMNHTIQIGLDLSAKVLLVALFERNSMAKAGIVNNNVQTSEVIACYLYRGPGCSRVCNIESHAAHLITITLHQIGEELRIARRRNQAIATRKNRLGNVAPEAARATSNQPDF